MKMYGATGLEHDWFISDLDNRKLLCTSSYVKEIICGVHQDSCLGPLLFLIYINSLPFSLQKFNCNMYADDKAISPSAKNIDDL